MLTVQYGCACLVSDILPCGCERLCPMPLLVLSTARSFAICLVVRGTAGFGRLVLVFECAFVRWFELIVTIRQAAIRRRSERIIAAQNW
jgi:hypothetical protein